MILAIIGIFFWITALIGWIMGTLAKKEMVSKGWEPTKKLKTWTTVSMVLTLLGILFTLIFIFM